MKPFAPACERNKQPILEKLLTLFAKVETVLEIGSGSGQHAVHFARALPHLRWYTSDLREHHAGIRLWMDEAGLANLAPPLELDVGRFPWKAPAVQAVFTANTLHILSLRGVTHLFEGVGMLLKAGGLLAVYGPFNYGGAFTSPGNRDFDAWLKAEDPARGIRNFEDMVALGLRHGLVHEQDLAMPANNRLLVWRKS